MPFPQLTSLVVSVIHKNLILKLLRNDESATYFIVSYYERTSDHILYCTMFSLQVCFLLSEKSIRQSLPPSARITSRGSRSPCTIPIQ